MAQAPVKRSGASLVGGIVIALGIFVLALLLLGTPQPAEVAVAALISLAVGGWVRLADL